MTTLFMDGFDHYGIGPQSGAQLADGPYSSVQGRTCGVPSWGPARTGSACLVCAVSSAATTRVLPSVQNDLFVSFGWAIDSLAISLNDIITFYDGSGNRQCYLFPTATGALNFYSGNGTLLAGTSGPVVVSQNWHFFEMNLNTTSGTFTLRVDDASGSNTPILSVTNSALTGFSVGIIGLADCQFDSNIFSYYDDLFVRNASGTVNNSWLGDRKVATLFPNAVTSTNAWTPSYYQLFGLGIYQGAYSQASNQTIQNQSATIGVYPATSLHVGANAFTWETMIRWDALPASTTYSSIFSQWNASSPAAESYRLILGGSSYNGGCLQFDTSTDGTTATQQTMIKYPWTPQTNTWYHLAICRVGGELLLFINGVQQGLPIADTRTYYTGGFQYLAIGQEFTQTGTDLLANTYMAARLDETRFTNGVGRYTSTFTPPTAAFPRGSSDPYWSSVVLLMGYDTAVVDESSFAQNVITSGGATSFQPSDGASIGSYSTVNKATPDDNTFISANFVNATNVFTMTTQPTNGNTVTVGTTNGTTAAVYTFKTAISSAFDVLIDTSAENTLTNLVNAINAGPGAGTKYGTGTTSNYNVNATLLPTGQFLVTANVAGSAGNSIASTATGTAASWNTATLTGGSNIPGPTNFTLQRPPNNTTIISATQLVTRALKTDSGAASIETAFIGALGGTVTSSNFGLTTSPTYYNLIMELDPDSSGPISPTTLVNGQIQVNRTA